MPTTRVSIDNVQQLASQLFGFEAGQVTQLAGYVDLNFLVVGEEKWVFKMTPDSIEAPFRKVLSRVQWDLVEEGELAGKIPRPRRSVQGNWVEAVEIEGAGRYWVQVQEWLEGSFYAESEKSPELNRSLGRLLGQLDAGLARQEALELHARHIKWDLQRTLLDSAPDAHHLLEPEQRRLVQYFLQGFRTEAQSIFQTLPRQLIHNDANDWNVLCEGDRVAGLIDFGDAVYAPRIQEVAVALAYVMMDREYPLAAAQDLIHAYHQEWRLSKEALSILYWLIAARLCISVISSNKARNEAEADDYTVISERPAWDLLHQLHRINPLRATQAFLEAIGETPEPVPTNEQLLSQRRRSFSRAMSISYDEPIHMVRGGLQYMYSADGRTYLDCVNNIPHVGHNHPAVVEAIARQAARLNTNTRYLYPLLTDYAERLLGYFPLELNRVFLVNSGSAATDLALRIAHTVTQRQQWLVLEHGYHGNTFSSIGVSHYKYAGKGGPGTPSLVHELKVPDLLRNLMAAPSPLPENFEPAAFIHETIVGCGGQLVLPPGWLAQWYALVRDRGGLCIADEVQTGFGRVGGHFWAYQSQGLVPDIVIMGKPIANGHPMGAVVTTTAIADAFANGMEFFSSFGGNPVSCAAGLAVLDVLESEELQVHAKEVGGHLVQSWEDLAMAFPQIGEVRGAGMFLGIEMVRDDGRFTPDAKLAHRLVNELRRQGFLLSTDGPHHNVIKFKPPLCFSRANADQLTDALKETLERLVN